MARRPDTRDVTETLQEIDSGFDRLSAWVTDHPALVLAILGGVLLVAGALGLAETWSRRAEARASAAVAEVQDAYLRSMGAAPGSYEVVEPANPETGRAARREAIEKFLTVSDEHAGTTAAVTARLEAGNLLEQTGDAEAALQAFERAAEQAPGGSALQGVAWVRLARGYEAQGRWEEAAATHARAGGLESLPTRAFALADAARCYAEAGDTARALELFAQAEEAAGDEPLPAHIAAPLRELRAVSPIPAPPVADAP